LGYFGLSGLDLFMPINSADVISHNKETFFPCTHTHTHTHAHATQQQQQQNKMRKTEWKSILQLYQVLD
jgi:hypothetical protein